MHLIYNRGYSVQQWRTHTRWAVFWQHVVDSYKIYRESRPGSSNTEPEKIISAIVSQFYPVPQVTWSHYSAELGLLQVHIDLNARDEFHLPYIVNNLGVFPWSIQHRFICFTREYYGHLKCIIFVNMDRLSDDFGISLSTFSK